MPSYIFTRVKEERAAWDLVEEVATKPLAHKAMIDYRKLCKEHGEVDVIVINAETAEKAREQLKPLSSEN